MRDVAGLSFQRQGGVATVTLNRPERLNAITWKMVEGLIDFTEECSRDDAIRVIVITGNGRAFSSGDDIVEGMGEVPTRHGARRVENLGRLYAIEVHQVGCILH